MVSLSKTYGFPASYDSAIKQHSELAKKLKNNEVYSFPFQNRGYLVLLKRYKNQKFRDARQIQYYSNILQKSKPTGRDVIKFTKV
jgi:hypothetical protein